MPNEQERALTCDRLAADFGRAAEDDARADEFRRSAFQLAGGHPEAAGAEELRGVAAYWDERAAWARDMAARFRRRAAEHRARFLSGL